MNAAKKIGRPVEVCPRCGGPLRQSPYDLGALSRYDTTTIVCRGCEVHEALVEGRVGRNIDRKGRLHPVRGMVKWIVPPA
jgi:hypothetical protein